MSFTWRELWSRKNKEHYNNLKFAVSGGVVLFDDVAMSSRYLVIDEPKSQLRVFLGIALCCWNGDFVFYNSLPNKIYRERNGEIQELQLEDCMRVIHGAVALMGVGLLIVGFPRWVLVRDNSDGQMEVVQTYGSYGDFDTFDICRAAPWQNGVLYHDYHDFDKQRIVFYTPTFQERKLLFLGLKDCNNIPVIFSDEKYACVVSGEPKELREWNAHGRERVFPVAKGSALSRVVRPGGTCRGRAFLLINASSGRVEHHAGPFKPFVYLGGGRLDDGPPGHGQWAAYGDRAYRLCDGTLTCYEALETPASLLELCASRATAVEYTERQLGTLPLELRELLIS